MFIIDGMPHSPYFVFIKGINAKSDSEILEFFNLGRGKEVENDESFTGEFCIHLFRNSNWICLMDNWFYTYRHSEKFSNRINELGKEYEIFTCTVGNADLYFDFKYFKNGQKIREYVVESPNYNDEVLKTDFGTPLYGEQECLKLEDQLDRVLSIACHLGIELPKNENEIKCYKLK
jgi:hypothetical protein